MLNPPKVMIHIRVTIEEREWLAEQANNHRASVSELLNALIGLARDNPDIIPGALRARRNL